MNIYIYVKIIRTKLPASVINAIHQWPSLYLPILYYNTTTLAKELIGHFDHSRLINGLDPGRAASSACKGTRSGGTFIASKRWPMAIGDGNRLSQWARMVGFWRSSFLRISRP